MERGPLVERVRRLLALADADRNPNQNEAEQAARIATKLMLDNKIEMAEVKRADFDEYMVLGCRAGRKNIPLWRRRLIQVLARFNFCEIMIFKGAEARHKFGGIVFLVGHRDDAQVVKLIHDHVMKQIEILRARALKHLHAPKVHISMGFFGMEMRQESNVPHGPKLRQWNNAFNLGMVDGIYIALEDQRHQAEVDENSKAIVRHADAQTRDFIKSQVGELEEHKDTPKEVKDINAYIAGRVASEMVEVGTGKKPVVRGHYLEEKTDG